MVHRRWKSIRTCFVRELNHQKEEAEKRAQNIPVKRRKVYSYFRHMMFLAPDEEGFTKFNEPDESDSDSSDDDNKNYQTPLNRKRRVKMEPEVDIKHFQNVFEPQIETENDEDKHFLLSLLPSFRKLSDKQKFDARIEILKVMRDIHNRGEHSANTQVSAQVSAYEHHTYTQLGVLKD